MLETISPLSKSYHRWPDHFRSIGDAQARTRIESFLEMIGGNARVTG